MDKYAQDDQRDRSHLALEGTFCASPDEGAKVQRGLLSHSAPAPFGGRGWGENDRVIVTAVTVEG